MLTSKIVAVAAVSALAFFAFSAVGCSLCPRTERSSPAVTGGRVRTGPAKITVTPEVCVNPVKTQHVFVATVTDDAGNPLSGVDVEWILSRGGAASVGDIIDVDGGHKVDNGYARSTTGRSAYTISRGNDNAQDDVRIGPGQTWCVITSSEEGQSDMIAYAPAITDWDHHKAFAVKNWMDVGWEVPTDATNRVGEPHTFNFRAFRYSDKSPIAGYNVTWTVLSGDCSLNDSGKSFSAKTDDKGVATVKLTPGATTPGTSEVRIDVVRPAGKDECRCWSEALVGSWTIKKTWVAPSIAIVKTAPARETVGCPFTYEIVVTNTSRELDVREVVVTDPLPAGIVYEKSEPAADVSGSNLRWNTGTLAPGGSCSMRVTVHSTQAGAIENCATVTAEGGLTAKACATTTFSAPKLTIQKTGPAQATACDPITYQIIVCNTGDGDATNVRVVDTLPAGLTTTDQIEWNVGTLTAGETRTFTLCGTAKEPGRLENVATVTADGGLTARATIVTEFVKCQLEITKTAPDLRYFGRPLAYRITVRNVGPVDATGVVVEDPMPTGVTFQNASDGGACNGTTVVWRLGTLAKGQSKTVGVATVVCATEDTTITNTASAHGDCCDNVTASAATRITGRSGILLECVDVDDPIEVGGTENYVIDVINQGNAVDHNVVIKCTLPDQEEFVSAEGPDGLTATVSGGVITFAPIVNLPPATDAPNNRKTYHIRVRAKAAGDVRFRTELTSDMLTSPVTESESTHIY